MGKYYPNIHCSHDNSCVVNLGVKLKIALTGVRNRIKESLAKRLIKYFLTLYSLLKLAYFFVKSAFRQFKK